MLSFPADYGTYCRAWLKDFSSQCKKEGGPDADFDNVPTSPVCEDQNTFCFVKEDCPTAEQYLSGNLGISQSRENCKEQQTTEEAGALATTSAP